MCLFMARGGVSLEVEAQTSHSQDVAPLDLSSLQPGQEVTGRVVKISKIGAIINVGGYPALLHISEVLGARAGRGPRLQEGDEATVWISDVDRERKRLLVTRNRPPANPISSLTVGGTVSGKIVRLTKFGAFVDIGAEKDGLIHISELAHNRVEDPADVVQVGETVELKVLSIDVEKGQVSLSLKATTPEPVTRFQSNREERPVMTPMEAAWKEAFSDSDPSRRSRPPKRKRRQRERGMPKGEERDDLFLRTLRYRS